MLLRIFLVANLLRPSTADVIVTPPRNTALVEGRELRIACGTNSAHSNLRWHYTPLLGTKKNTMNTRATGTLEAFSEFGLIPGHNGSYDLYTGSVKMTHAGLYSCEVTIKQRENLATFLEASAHLTVLRSDPVCRVSSNSTNGYLSDGYVVIMTCTVQYNGTWEPSMSWYQETRNGLLEKTDFGIVTPDTSITGQVVSTLKLSVNSYLHGLTFVCVTHFEKIPPVKDRYEDRQPPEYSNRWRSEVFNVSYSPRNLTFSSTDQQFAFGEKVSCWADGNPPPKYEWKNLATKEIIHGPDLSLNSSTFLKEKTIHKFRCTATNIVGNGYDDLIFTMNTQDESGRLVLVLVVGLSGIIVIIIMIAVVVFGIYRQRNLKTERKKKRKRNPSTKDGCRSDAHHHVTNISQSPDVVSTASDSASSGSSSHNYAHIDYVNPTQLPEVEYNDLDTEQRDPPVRSLYRSLERTGQRRESPSSMEPDNDLEEAAKPLASYPTADYYNVTSPNIPNSEVATSEGTKLDGT